jgi:hypothetical protein
MGGMRIMGGENCSVEVRKAGWGWLGKSFEIKGNGWLGRDFATRELGFAVLTMVVFCLILLWQYKSRARAPKIEKIPKEGTNGY